MSKKNLLVLILGFVRVRMQRIARIVTTIAIALSTLLPSLPAHAAVGNLTSSSVTLSTSKAGTTVYPNWQIEFTTATAIASGANKIRIKFPAVTGTDPFTIGTSIATADLSLALGTCAGAGMASLASSDSDGDSKMDAITVTLTTTSIPASSACTLSILGTTNNNNGRIQNPAKVAATGTSDIYAIQIETMNASSTVIDSSSVSIALNDATSVSATVNDTLTLTVAGLPSATTINGAVTNVDTSGAANTVLFATLTPNQPKVAGQRLTIETNAAGGYNVYIIQSQDLTAGSNTIDQFKDGTRIDEGACNAWAAPSANLAVANTHGHLGYTTTDSTSVWVGGSCSTGDQWAGVPTIGTAAAAPVTTGLACNGAATNGDTCDVAYKVEISSLQPAGSYSNELYYVIVASY